MHDWQRVGGVNFRGSTIDHSIYEGEATEYQRTQKRSIEGSLSMQNIPALCSNNTDYALLVLVGYVSRYTRCDNKISTSISSVRRNIHFAHYIQRSDDNNCPLAERRQRNAIGWSIAVNSAVKFALIVSAITMYQFAMKPSLVQGKSYLCGKKVDFIKLKK